MTLSARAAARASVVDAAKYQNLLSTAHAHFT